MSDADRRYIFDAYCAKYGLDRAAQCGAGERGHRKRRGDWRPIRNLCSDYLLFAKVIRCNRHRFEVGLFLADDHHLFKKDSSVIGGIVTTLSDAYQMLGTMEVHFVGVAENPSRQLTGGDLERGFEPKVPDSICRVAADHGIFINRDAQRITAEQGRRLYERLTDLTDATSQRLIERGIPTERACFVVQRGIWNRWQTDFLVEHALSPDRLFRGGAPSEFRLASQRDILLMRLTIMAERVVTLLTQCRQYEHDRITGIRWLRNGLVWESTVPLTILSVVNASTVRIPRGIASLIWLSPRSDEEYIQYSMRELERITLSRDSIFPTGADSVVFWVVTQDFLRIPGEARSKILAKAHSSEVHILPIIDTIHELNEEIQRRLNSAMSTDREMPERPE